MPGSVMFSEARGEVIAFDDHAGWGTVRGVDGAEWFFHCARIADGTRSIKVDTQVAFDVVPGRLGRWEAAAVRPA